MQITDVSSSYLENGVALDEVLVPNVSWIDRIEMQWFAIDAH